MKLKRKLPVLVLAAGTAFVLACGFPSQEQVKADFRAEYPDFTPLSAMAGEGHGDAGYYHIRYKKPDDDKTYEQIWLYLRQDNGEFKLVDKERARVIE
jgi:hypothetical protein